SVIWASRWAWVGTRSDDGRKAIDVIPVPAQLRRRAGARRQAHERTRRGSRGDRRQDRAQARRARRGLLDLAISRSVVKRLKPPAGTPRGDRKDFQREFSRSVSLGWGQHATEDER